MREFSNFIPKDLQVNSWTSLKPYFEQLLQDPIASVADLKQFILNYSDVMSIYWESKARSYINVTCYTNNKEFESIDKLFSEKITPEVDVYSDKINRKIHENEFFNKLPMERFDQYNKRLKRQIEMFTEKNVPLYSKISQLNTKFEQITGGLTVMIDGQEMPMSLAKAKLKENDRSVREQAWRALREKWGQIKGDLDDLFDKMIGLRHQVAINAGYKNFKFYQHDNYQRFDYTPEDTIVFHDAIEKHILPLANVIIAKHRDKLKLTDDFRPWDSDGTPKDEKPLSPFNSGQELLEKTIAVFHDLHPQFAKNLKAMDQAKLFDLDSRKNKAPGGYNYGLEVTGMPFIFMNAAGTHDDVVTLMHEGGHAMHTFLTNDEPLLTYRDTPSEMAETASMSMELMSSSYWNKLYNDKDHKRARREHLEGIVCFFPWCATVDAFQHWIYQNPQHTHKERDEYFETLIQRLGNNVVNWQGLENYRRNEWQKQLHIFTVPFYYIEYGIAQLGALQIYRNFVNDPEKSLQGYINGLKLGASKSIPEVWQTMGIKFDFSEETIQELMAFVQQELAKLQD